jgi:hypothetical protein
MPLTDMTVRPARPKDKEYKLSYERGLLLLVRPTGAEWLRLRYPFQGTGKMIGLGSTRTSHYLWRDLWRGSGGMSRSACSPTARLTTLH